MRLNFNRICTLVAARDCYEAGQTPAVIAKSAGVHVSTVRRWLKSSLASKIRHQKHQNDIQLKDSVGRP